MRSMPRAALAVLPLVLAVPVAPAQADFIVDPDTLRAPERVDFGVVCPGGVRTMAVDVGLHRAGGLTFADDQVLDVSVTVPSNSLVSATAPATLSIMSDAITLPPTAANPEWHWSTIPVEADYVQHLAVDPVFRLEVPPSTQLGPTRASRTHTLVFSVEGAKASTVGRTTISRGVQARYTLGTQAECALADRVPPQVSLSHDAADGANGWFVTDPVPVTVTASDNHAVTGLTCTDNGHPVPVHGGTISVVGEGTHALSCTAWDGAGNSGSGSDGVSIDTIAPTVVLDGPDGVTVDFGDPLPPYSCEASDATSGLTGPCSVDGAGATSVGTHTVTATATDQAGHVSTDTSTYTVRAWTLDGFYRPVDRGALNTVKAGSTVPLKFNVLKGDPGAPLTEGIGAAFTAHPVDCVGHLETDAVEELASTGQTVLRYDADGAQWVQNWATPRSGAGGCYRVTLTTADGSSTSALFKLR